MRLTAPGRAGMEAHQKMTLDAYRLAQQTIGQGVAGFGAFGCCGVEQFERSRRQFERALNGMGYASRCITSWCMVVRPDRDHRRVRSESQCRSAVCQASKGSTTSLMASRSSSSSVLSAAVRRALGTA